MSSRTLTASGLADGGRRLVLIVHRDSSLLTFLAFLLEDEGWAVRETTSLAAARVASALELPDILIWDVDLPDAEPREMVRMLRADPATAVLPVVFVTLRADDLEAAWADEPRSAVLGIPFEIDDLLQVMARLLRGG